MERIVVPWRNRRELVAQGTTVPPERLIAIQVVRTDSRVTTEGDDFRAAYIRASAAGENVTDEFLVALAPIAESAAPHEADPRSVFVVHGRDASRRDALYELLRALGLRPIEWEQAVRMTGSGSPTILDVLRAGLSNARAIVILMTGDDLARGNPGVVADDPGEERPQPRPNVLFEAGWAFGSAATETVILEVGDLRGLSDLAGVHAVRTSMPEWRGALSTRLETAGCAVDTSGTDWLAAGAALESS